jgi:hypothetical protein
MEATIRNMPKAQAQNMSLTGMHRRDFFMMGLLILVYPLRFPENIIYVCPFSRQSSTICLPVADLHEMASGLFYRLEKMLTENASIDVEKVLAPDRRGDLLMSPYIVRHGSPPVLASRPAGLRSRFTHLRRAATAAEKCLKINAAFFATLRWGYFSAMLGFMSEDLLPP